MPLQIWSDWDCADAIDFAVDHGARVISISSAWSQASFPILTAIQRAGNAGVVVVVAAGNGGSSGLTSQPGADLSTTPVWPAYNRLSNTINVAAVDSSGNLASFSNYGATTVDLAAPGVDIYTTELTGGYINFASGTSFAAPFVAGVVALVASQYPSYTATQLVLAVTQNTKPLTSLAGKTISGGMVSAYNALLAGIPNPTASASPSTVVGTTTALSVNGSYGGGEPGLKYTWSVIGQPSGVSAPAFSVNGTNAAKNATATFYGAGSYTFQVTVSNDSGYSRNATVPVTVSGASQPNPDFRDDSQGAGFSKVGTWTTWTTGGFLGTHSTAPSGDGSMKATWTFDNLSPGIYEVWTTRVQAPDRATNSPFTVFDGSTALGTVRLDQSKIPIGHYDQGNSWNTLGQSFSITSGTLKVVLSNDADAGKYVVADVVRIRKLGPWYGDDSQAAGDGFSRVGPWTTWTGGGYQNTHSTAPGGDGSTTATWTFSNLAPGKYQVWATWVQDANRATNSPFTIYDASTSRGTVLVDQSLGPAGAYAPPTTWKSPGENFTIDSGTLTVKLTNGGVSSSKYVAADGIRIQRVGSDFADDSDGAGIYDKTSGWTQWTTVGNGVDNTHSTAPGGDGSIYATWTFKGLTPGIYEVWATWVQAPDRATNSPFSVYDGTSLLNAMTFNQTVAPTGYFDYGVSFVSLGQSYAINSGTLIVKLSNSGVASNAYVVADAIRINRVGNPTSGTTIPFFASPDGEVLDLRAVAPSASFDRAAQAFPALSLIRSK